MNANERNIAVKSPLSSSKVKSGDLSSAEMPEVIVVADEDAEQLGNVPAPLTIADVEGGELKPIGAKSVKVNAPSPKTVTVDPEIAQVRFKTLEGRLNLLLPSIAKNKREFGQDDGDADKLVQLFGKSNQGEDNSDRQGEGESNHQILDSSWEDMIAQLEQRLAANGYDWQPRTQVFLQAGDRLLDTRQLHQIEEALENYQLLLHCVVTNRRQTAINAASMGLFVEQGTTFQELLGFNPIPDAPIDDPLYIKMTVRSGTEIRHSGSIIVFGDVNAGAELISEGDIIVWGKLKGLAHAGVKGNAQAIVMALHLDATQIRIASFIARVESPSTSFCPEVAFVSNQGTPVIQIVQAAEYSVKAKS